MDKSMLTGLVVGAVVATAGGVIAGLNMLGDKEPAYAEVLNVVEATETVNTPREVCEDVPVTRQAPVQDEHKILGTVTGAVIGGVLGNQVGGAHRQEACHGGRCCGRWLCRQQGTGEHAGQGYLHNHRTPLPYCYR